MVIHNRKKQSICFKFELRLKKLSLLSVASSLWERPDVKRRIIKYGLDVVETMYDVFNKKAKWWEVIEYVLAQAEPLQLPSEVMHDVKSMVILTGEKYLAWFVHVYKDRLFDFKLTPQVFWTPYGTVNEIETFKELMSKKPNHLMEFKGVSSIRKDLLFLIATSFGNLDLVPQLIREQNMVDLSLEQLFLFCARSGYIEGADYFYGKVKDKENFWENALSFVHTSERDDILDFANENYDMEQKPELLLYLLKKMPEVERNDFIIQYFPSVYSIFKKSWPYVQINMELLNYWECLSPDVQSKMLKLTLDMFKYEFPRNGWYAYYSLYQPVLENILLITSKEIKFKFFRENRGTIFGFFEISRYTLITTIINDPDLKEFRSEILNISEHLQFHLRKKDGNGRNVENYMRVFKFSEDEKLALLKFTENIDHVLDMLSCGHFNNADNVIRWHLYLKGEKEVEDSKRRIRDFIKPSIFMVYNDFESLKKYLNWLCDGDVEKLQKLKTEMFSWKLIVRMFWILWINIAVSLNRKDQCSEFFNYFFKTEEELSLFTKKYVESEKFLLSLIDPEILQYYYFSLELRVMPYLDEIYNDIFSISIEKTNEIKKKIKDNIDEWFDLCGDKFLVFNGILKWVTVDEEERKRIVKGCVDSPKGPLYCVNIIKSDLDNNTSGQDKLCSKTWLCECINGEEEKIRIRDRIEDLKGSDGVDDNDVDRVVEWLNVFC